MKWFCRRSNRHCQKERVLAYGSFQIFFANIFDMKEHQSGNARSDIQWGESSTRFFPQGSKPFTSGIFLLALKATEAVTLASYKAFSVGGNYFLLPAEVDENIVIAGSWWEEVDLDTEGVQCLCPWGSLDELTLFFISHLKIPMFLMSIKPPILK